MSEKLKQTTERERERKRVIKKYIEIRFSIPITILMRIISKLQCIEAGSLHKDFSINSQMEN